MTALALDRRRLANLLGMVGSAHDGEVVNAARLADRLVRNAGLTWHQALGTDHPPLRPERADDDDDDLEVLGRWPGGWRTLARDCGRLGSGILTEWEMQFCITCSAIRYLSRKQARILRRLADRLMLEGRFA